MNAYGRPDAGEHCEACDEPFVEGDEAAWNQRGKFHDRCIPTLTDAYFFAKVRNG